MKKILIYLCVLLSIFAIFLSTIFAEDDVPFNNQRVTDHFYIRYVKDPNNTVHFTPESQIDKVAQIAEESWNYLIVQKKFKRHNDFLTDPIPNDKKIVIKVVGFVEDPAGTLGDRVYGITEGEPIEGTNLTESFGYNTPHPSIKIDNNYDSAKYADSYRSTNSEKKYLFYGDIALREVILHEFFHVIQSAYLYSDQNGSGVFGWINEGSASSTQNEPVVLYNENIEKYNTYVYGENAAPLFLQSPNRSLIDNKRRYDNVLFFIYLIENYNTVDNHILEKTLNTYFNNSVKTIFEKISVYGPGESLWYEVCNYEMLRAIGMSVGDAKEDFSLTASYGNLKVKK